MFIRAFHKPVFSLRVTSTVVRRNSDRVDTPDSQRLYRGVPTSHPGYEEARRGIVSPAQNTAYLAEDIVIAATNHNEGSSSGFSSWTKNKKVAEAFAGDEGVVLEAIVGPDHGQRLMWSPDSWLEDEVIVQGEVGNAKTETIRLKGKKE